MLSFKRLAIVSGVALGLVAMAATAQAATIIDFGTGGTTASGTITSSGGAVTGGSGIALGTMTFDLSTIYDTSGSGIGSSTDLLRTIGSPNGSATLSFNVAAGTFEIDGGIGGLNSSNTFSSTVANVTPLVTGTLLSFSASGNQVNFVGGKVVLASTFATAFGIGTIPYTVNSAFVINNSGQTVSSDVNITSVPEPGSILMLGTGLVGLATGLRRRIVKR